MSESQHTTNVSDELLNSFIDGQLMEEERQEILASLQQNKDLARQVCELQRIKQMTHLAYETIPPSQLPAGIIERDHTWTRIAAAVAIFCLGILLGTADLRQVFSSDASWQQAQNDATTKVLVHLTSSDSETGLSTLTNLELMLQRYRDQGQQVQVEVIANGHGINLLRQGITPFADLIARLSDEYDNLSFAACKNTIDQIQITENADIELIPEARLIDSGVVEVIERQKQGWTYIRG